MTPCIPRIAMLAMLTVGLVGSVAGITAADVTPAQQAAMLAAHNTLRRTTGSQETQRLGQTVTIPDLTWNAAAAAVAQTWANNLLATNTFAHNANRGFLGENIYMESGSDPATSADRAFASWAAEAASYSWDTNACTDDCSHYTQIVWAGTTSVGCGMATDGTNTYWVCDYAPPGNVVGQRPYEPGGPAAQPATGQPAATPPPAVQPSPTPPPAATQPPAATGGTATWSGAWTVADFGWGVGGALTLRQDGNQVMGTYTYVDPSGCGTQRGTVTGTASAGVLTLTFIETGCAGDATGAVSLTLSADGARFTGDWSGTRAGQ
jgi:pathogenesis-related protein 1